MINKLPILLVATERSGTNLLRAIMSSHSQIASPPPFSMIDVMAGTYYKYLADDKQDHFNVLIQDAIKLTQSHLNPWTTEYSTEDVQQKVNEQSFWEVFKALNELYAESEHKPSWFSKEPGLFKCIYQLAMHLPEAKFVYMIRDPRDVVVSMLKGGIHEHNAYNAAFRWRDEQRLCLNAILDPLLKGRIFMMSYEALLEDSEHVVRKLMDFLGITFEPSQLEFYKDEKVVTHAKKSKFWQNLSKPIDQANKGRYKTKLTGQQLKIIESLCWDEMKALGYQPETAQPAKISLAQRFFYRTQARMRQLIKIKLHSDESKKHQIRRRVVSEIQQKRFN